MEKERLLWKSAYNILAFTSATIENPGRDRKYMYIYWARKYMLDVGRYKKY